MMDITELKANWNYPTAIWFGVERIKELPDACRQAGMRCPLFVTDPRLASLPAVQETIELNRQAGLPTGLFYDVRPNPVNHNVEHGVQAFREGGHDGVIAFGGGSAMDVGKSIAFMLAQTRPIWDFEDIGDYYKRANTDGIAPVIAVPTTAGTGSEVGRGAVITDETTHTKKIIFHPKMMPAVAILDPQLTAGLPPHLTAYTGMDALAHNLEAYCSPGYHPLADGIAIEGIRLIKDWLAQAVKDGQNLTARAHMLVAASMGATAFQKGLGAIHALSHPIGALYDTHHGLTNAVLMPYVLAFNRTAIENKMIRLSAYLGLQSPSFEAIMDWILTLRTEIGIPHTLQELGVEAERIDEMARMAEVDPPAAGNPIKVSTPELKRIYLDAMEGFF
jgi:alcohol dehydrogenase class IV